MNDGIHMTIEQMLNCIVKAKGRVEDFQNFGDGDLTQAYKEICLVQSGLEAALAEKQADVADTVPPAEYFFENDNWDITYHRGEHEDEAMVNAPPNEIVEFRLLKDVGAVYMVNLTDAEGNSEIREFANEDLAKAALAAQIGGK